MVGGRVAVTPGEGEDAGIEGDEADKGGEVGGGDDFGVGGGGDGGEAGGGEGMDLVELWG